MGPGPHRSHSEEVRGSSLASNAVEACKVKAQGIAHSVLLSFSHGSGDYLEPVPHGARDDGATNSHPFFTRTMPREYAPARLAPAVGKPCQWESWQGTPLKTLTGSVKVELIRTLQRGGGSGGKRLVPAVVLVTQ